LICGQAGLFGEDDREFACTEQRRRLNLIFLER